MPSPYAATRLCCAVLGGDATCLFSAAPEVSRLGGPPAYMLHLGGGGGSLHSQFWFEVSLRSLGTPPTSLSPARFSGSLQLAYLCALHCCTMRTQQYALYSTFCTGLYRTYCRGVQNAQYSCLSFRSSSGNPSPLQNPQFSCGSPLAYQASFSQPLKLEPAIVDQKVLLHTVLYCSSVS